MNPEAARKYLDIREFREHGYLMEANRQFFHPLGLALEVIPPASEDETQIWRLGGIQDCREDPEGVTFSRADGTPGLTVEDSHRARRIADERASKTAIRAELFKSNSTVEPFPRDEE